MHSDGLKGECWRTCGMKEGLLCGQSNSRFCSLIKWPQNGALSFPVQRVGGGTLRYEGLCQAHSFWQWIGRLLQSVRTPGVYTTLCSFSVVGALPQSTRTWTSGFWGPVKSSGCCSLGCGSFRLGVSHKLGVDATFLILIKWYIS